MILTFRFQHAALPNPLAHRLRPTFLLYGLKSMVQIIHRTRDDSDVSIDGKLIHESSATVDLTEFDERTLRFKVFASAGGGFSVVIEFRSSNYNIKDVVEVECVDTAHDVEAVLSLFEPTDYVHAYTCKGKSQYAFEHNLPRKQLIASYYDCLDEMEKAVNEYVLANPGCENI